MQLEHVCLTCERYLLFLITILTSLNVLTGVKMAGRRAAVKAIDWLAFAERVPPNQRAMFNSLKTRSDSITAK